MPLKFTKYIVSAEAFESAEVFDVNNDGVLDIVSGGFWYQGPDFKKRHAIGMPNRVGEYYDDFSTIPLDVNGDGNMDFITGGWFGQKLVWRENPGIKGGEWPTHVIGEIGNVETTRAWDIDGDGQLEILPNTPNHALRAYKLVRDANGKGTGKFQEHILYNKAHGHGLGCGDIDGDGKLEIILNKGILKAPANPLSGEWTFSPEFDLGGASIPILVVDLNGDGLGDLIVGQAHGYGLDWYEQRVVNGKRTWTKHAIDPHNSQYHDMQWIDIDGDGKPELVTGKRFRAHCGSDPGEFDDSGIYYFKWDGKNFVKQIIAYGSMTSGLGAGCGIYFAMADLRKTGRLDLIAPGKDGLKIFFNEGL